MKGINSYTKLLSKYNSKESIKKVCPLINNKDLLLYDFNGEYISKPQVYENKIAFVMYNKKLDFWYDDIFFINEILDLLE